MQPKVFHALRYSQSFNKNKKGTYGQKQVQQTDLEGELCYRGGTAYSSAGGWGENPQETELFYEQ